MASLHLAFNGPFAYVASDDGRRIFGYRVGVDGGLSPLTPPSRGTAAKPGKVAASPDVRWLYVLAAGRRRVWRYRVGPDGGLTPGGDQVLAGVPDSLTFVRR